MHRERFSCIWLTHLQNTLGSAPSQLPTANSNRTILLHTQPNEVRDDETRYPSNKRHQLAKAHYSLFRQQPKRKSRLLESLQITVVRRVCVATARTNRFLRLSPSFEALTSAAKFVACLVSTHLHSHTHTHTL